MVARRIAWLLLAFGPFALGLTVAAPSARAGDDGLFLQSQHHQSRRSAILEDDGRTAYLYLTDRGKRTPVRAAVVYTRAPLAPAQDWSKVKDGAPPELSLDIASPSAVVPFPRAPEFSFRWSADGESVALLRKDVPVALVSSHQKLGYSKAVNVPSALANPWDQGKFVALFTR